MELGSGCLVVVPDFEFSCRHRCAGDLAFGLDGIGADEGEELGLRHVLVVSVLVLGGAVCGHAERKTVRSRESFP